MSAAISLVKWICESGVIGTLTSALRSESGEPCARRARRGLPCVSAPLNHPSWTETVQTINEMMKPAKPEITQDTPPIKQTCGVQPVGLLKDIDLPMQENIAFAMKQVKKKQDEQQGFMGFDDMNEMFENHPQRYTRVPCGEGIMQVMREEFLVETPGTTLNFSAGVSSADCQKALTAMKDCVQDQKIWDALQIDTKLISEIFGADGVPYKLPFDFMHCEQHRAHVAIDIGVVRFPAYDIGESFFKLYRFRVIVFSSQQEIMAVNFNSKRGLLCKYQESRFKMTDAWADAVMKKTDLHEKIQKVCKDELEDLYG